MKAHSVVFGGVRGRQNLRRVPVGAAIADLGVRLAGCGGWGVWVDRARGRGGVGPVPLGL